jgi:parallel beta-helix repeat protein
MCLSRASRTTGIQIEGHGTHPVVSGNKIHDGKDAGVFVHEGSSGDICGNAIYQNAMFGVEIRDKDTHPMLHGNTIRDGKHAGVFVGDSASATIDENDIFGNAWHAVQFDQATCTVAVGSSNRIRERVLTGREEDEDEIGHRNRTGGV